MAATRETTAKNIKPLEGAIIRRVTCGGTVAAGEFVTMSSDGKVDPTNTTAAAQKVFGVAIQGGSDGSVIDVVTHGPIQCMTAATIGGTVFATDTAGEPGESAGTNSSIAGIAESATVLFVRPSIQ